MMASLHPEQTLTLFSDSDVVVVLVVVVDLRLAEVKVVLDLLNLVIDLETEIKPITTGHIW